MTILVSGGGDDSNTTGHFLGVYDDYAALISAYPTGVKGDTALLTSTATTWYWDTSTSVWEDTEIGSTGDMLASIYDPTSKQTSAFSMSSMIETTSAKILTAEERIALEDATTKLNTIEEGAEVNVQADWEQTDTGADDYINNKPDKAYCDYQVEFAVGIPSNELTTTPRLLIGWGENITPKNITEANGVITSNASGIYHQVLERVYWNADKKPTEQVYVTLAIHRNDIEVFSRTVPISSASTTGEPVILSFTTPFMLNVTAGDEFKIYVSAEDDGGDPQETYLTLAHITSTLYE